MRDVKSDQHIDQEGSGEDNGLCNFESMFIKIKHQVLKNHTWGNLFPCGAIYFQTFLYSRRCFDK